MLCKLPPGEQNKREGGVFGRTLSSVTIWQRRTGLGLISQSPPRCYVTRHRDWGLDTCFAARTRSLKHAIELGHWRGVDRQKRGYLFSRSSRCRPALPLTKAVKDCAPTMLLAAQTIQGDIEISLRHSEAIRRCTNDYLCDCCPRRLSLLSRSIYSGMN